MRPFIFFIVAILLLLGGYDVGSLEFLRVPPGNRLEALKSNRAGHFISPRGFEDENGRLTGVPEPKILRIERLNFLSFTSTKTSKSVDDA